MYALGDIQQEKNNNPLTVDNAISINETTVHKSRISKKA